MMLETIKLEQSPRFIKFTSKELSAICPVDKRPDIYIIEIEFSPKNQTLEMHCRIDCCNKES